MWIFRLNRFFRNFFRFLNILFIIIRHTFTQWFFTRRPIRRFIDPKRKKLMTRSERIRLVVEDLGPTFIKFGQIVADRPDLVSEQLRVELKKLQTSAKPFDNDLAYLIIEEELGDHINEIFEQIDPDPVASASIAQVYRAVLKDGRVVAVKVQRPHIKQKIRLDLVLMKVLAQQAVKSYPELANFNLVSFVEDFGAIMMKELDFANEASNMMRFSEMFKDDFSVHIPEVYNKYTTQKVLVMEWVEGLRPGDIKGMKENGYDTKKIAENGTHVIIKMILKYGFFHADPHAGNMFIGKNNQLILLDHGMTSGLKPKQIDALISFLLGFSENNEHKIAKALLGLMEIGYYKNMEELEFDINELVQKYSYISYGKMNVSNIMTESFRIILRHGLKVPSSLYMLIKAIGTIQKFAEDLDADISVIEFIKPYARERIVEKFSWENIWGKIVNSAEDYLYLVDTLPKDIKEIVSNLRKGVLRHEINFREDSFTNKALRQGTNRLAFVFIMGLLLVCSTMLLIYRPDSNITTGFFYTTIIVTGLTAIGLFIKTKFS
jgi:ubiquinone biosynthesis protein